MTVSSYFSCERFRLLGWLGVVPVLSLASLQAAFTGLGFLSEEFRYSQAYAISADGSTVVGTSAYVGADDEAYLSSFKWTAAGGMVELPRSSATAPASHAYGISDDGSVIVGMEIQAGGSSARAYRYQSGVVDLLPNLVSTNLGMAEGISGDGSIIVGSAPDGFRWTQVGGTVPLPMLAGGSSSSAYAISRDGTTIVGTAQLAAGGLRAFRWTETAGVQSLLIPNAEESAAHAVSADGTTIVGAFLDQTNQLDVPFAWTELGVVVFSSLSAEEGVLNRAYAVSADGTRAAGESGKRAAIWNALTGEVTDLETFLASHGITGLEGWELISVLGMSADGLTFTGIGLNPEGDSEAWVAAVPEPLLAELLLIGCGGLLLRRRRRA